MADTSHWVNGGITISRPLNDREMEELALRWRRQYGEPSERDYLAEALAAEEHRHGMGYGDDAEHCDECKREAARRLQAECEHDGENIDVSTCGTRELLCQRCGLVREVER